MSQVNLHPMKNAVLHCCWMTYILIGTISSCKVADTPGPSVAQNPSILFLNYTIRKDNGQAVRIELVNKIIKEGTVKSTPGKTTFETGDLKCSALDINKRTLHSIYIQDPLHKFVEYEDSTGHLTRKEMWLDSAEFSVRMQLPANTKFVTIERIDTAGNHPLLITEIN